MVEYKTVDKMNDTVFVYSRQGCGGCNLTKAWLKDHNIPYVELNIDNDPEARKDLLNSGFKSLPVVAIGTLDFAWSGHCPDKLNGIVEMRG